VVLNNAGGGIFDFLPVAGETDLFEEHVATPPGLDVAGAAAAFGLRHVAAGDQDGLVAALNDAVGGTEATIIEVATQRTANVALHRRVWEAVSAALAKDAPVSPPAPAGAPPA
jgi:2-succinyl-5-enolpyruvyl-6-hydroxy-3-cyclohexene-1-carboxylate synthase